MKETNIHKVQKTRRSSAKIKNLKWLTELHRSLKNTLKRKGPRTEPCSTPEVA
jgi:hypothetical protein